MAAPPTPKRLTTSVRITNYCKQIIHTRRARCFTTNSRIELSAPVARAWPKPTRAGQGDLRSAREGLSRQTRADTELHAPGKVLSSFGAASKSEVAVRCATIGRASSERSNLRVFGGAAVGLGSSRDRRRRHATTLISTTTLPLARKPRPGTTLPIPPRRFRPRFLASGHDDQIHHGRRGRESCPAPPPRFSPPSRSSGVQRFAPRDVSASLWRVGLARQASLKPGRERTLNQPHAA